MSIFNGKRVTQRGGGNAGRGDNPHALLEPSSQRNAVPDTRAARKANSPRRMQSALKNVNKNPMGVHEDEYSTKFSSDYGFAESPQSLTYLDALSAEERLANRGDNPTYSKQTAKTLKGNDIRSLEERDSDRVGAYVNTGEQPHSGAGAEWVRNNGTARYSVNKDK